MLLTKGLIMNRKTYSFDEVCKNIVAFEHLLPVVDYNSYRHARFYFLYTDFYEFPLDSEVGSSEFKDRMMRYIEFTNQMNGNYPLSWIYTRIQKIKRSYHFKKWYSFIFKKKILISKDNPSIDNSHNLKD